MTFLRIDEDGFSFFKNNRDQIIGLNLTISNFKHIKNLTVEWINTKYQSGAGLPDPRLNGKGYLRNDILNGDFEFFKSELEKELGYEVNISTNEELLELMKQKLNGGFEYGGRDGYMSNGTYPGGWAFNGLIMGSPLNLTRNQLPNSAYNLGAYQCNYIANDRFRAFHIGAKGEITDNLIWKTMLTYSVNFGSYYDEYPPDRYTWEKTENYYFDGGLNQIYTMIGIEWSPKKNEKIIIKSDFALDTGEIFNNFGAKFGVSWSF
jgi:hypothetical protein